MNNNSKAAANDSFLVKNLKFLGLDGVTILTAGKSGKIPPGAVSMGFHRLMTTT